MQNINSFITFLGKNYYSDFLINVDSETIDFDSYGILVKYNSSYYYELNHSEILLKRKEIILSIKDLYHKALSEVYSLMLSHDQFKLNSYLEISIKTVKSHLNTLKKDFYTDSDESRYYSILEDNPIILDLEIVYQENLRNDDFDVDEKVFDIINNSNFKKVESLYFLGFLYQRYKTLSFIPFSLFQIGKQFLFELNKIKLLNESNSNEASVNTKNQSNMGDTYFDKFCEIIDDYTILKKSTAIGVMIDLVDCIKNIKSETLLELQKEGINRDDYLDYLINEIEKRNYVKDADISYVQKWLDEYKISIKDIVSRDYQNNSIEAVIDRHYNDMEKFSPEKDKALLVQTDFYFYFCKYYADVMILFFNSKKSNKTSAESKAQPSLKPFKDVMLEGFLKEINNIEDLYKYTFIQCYDFGIKRFTESLILEIKENILLLPQEKMNIYLEYVKDKIENSQNYSTNEISLDKWITAYKLESLNFPYLENKDVNQLITKSINYYLWDEEDRSLMEDIQLDFFNYAVKLESDKVINYINKLNPRITDNNTSTPDTITFDSIFKSIDAFHKFNKLVEYLNIDTVNVSLRGNQAKFSGIWSCPQSNKELFKELTELNKYIAFVNKTYKSNYKSRTFSDGSNYYVSIKNWLKEIS
ncbi:hypothetical protein [Flavobacterium filum]|uniref:hypothetical protein n=1 Tax=Flavobacterium filum TaxID=370974 RepID=UPI0023F13B70|nr:hypothetical protein [Flavobacterium filum]